MGRRRATASSRYTASYIVRLSANRLARWTRTRLLTIKGPRARKSATPSERCRRVNLLSVRKRLRSALPTSSKHRSGVHSSTVDSVSNKGATSAWAAPGARYSTKTLASATRAASAIPILPHQVFGAASHHAGRPATGGYPPSHFGAVYQLIGEGPLEDGHRLRRQGSAFRLRSGLERLVEIIWDISNLKCWHDIPEASSGDLSGSQPDLAIRGHRPSSFRLQQVVQRLSQATHRSRVCARKPSIGGQHQPEVDSAHRLPFSRDGSEITYILSSDGTFL